ncbi:MAG: hypothetical protein EZS28_001134 [Streblomastix strix]|uniref:Uncharacterized protein n=1 Tax=Streblomastix strix TaxID=222440 RepID=A0A5J4X9Y2_9EUKA|nr:MAG: hypothetical protein EZS28_001134 [Streblomastix strix]
MNETNWYNYGDIVPAQITSASDNKPLEDSGTGVALIQNDYARADHQHLLNADPTVANMQQKDTETGNKGNFNYYVRSNNQHPLNVDPTAANVPMVNATAAVNGTSDYYCRNYFVNPQQLTFDGNLTATKFIRTGGLSSEILCANGDTINLNGIKSQNFPQGVGVTAKYTKLCRFEAYNSYRDINVEFKFYSGGNVNGLKLRISCDIMGLNSITYHFLQQVIHASFRLPTMLYYGSGVNKYGELWMTVGDNQGNQERIDLLSQIIYGSAVVSNMLTNQIVDTLLCVFTTKEDSKPNQQYNTEIINNFSFLQNGIAQKNPENGNGNEGLRTANTSNNYSLFCIGCDPNSTSGAISNQ